jgi:hypothetical protein
MTSWRNSVDVLRAADAVLAPLAESVPVAVEGLRPRPGAGSGEVEIHIDTDIDAEADAVADWFARVRHERARAGAATTGPCSFAARSTWCISPMPWAGAASRIVSSASAGCCPRRRWSMSSRRSGSSATRVRGRR